MTDKHEFKLRIRAKEDTNKDIEGILYEAIDQIVLNVEAFEAFYLEPLNDPSGSDLDELLETLEGVDESELRQAEETIESLQEEAEDE